MSSRPLHIAVDGRELSGQPTGVGRYLLEIMRRWSVEPVTHRYTVIVPAAPSQALLDLGERFTWRVLPDSVAGTWWEQVKLPRVLAREKPDVLFAPAYTAPLRAACPFVLLVHDVSFCAHPEWFRWREGLRRRLVTRASARRASRVLTVSSFSRDEIQKYLGVPIDRIVLAPQGAPPMHPADTAERSPAVLYVGSLFNRRHIPGMIQAFARVVATVPAARFVLAGANRTSPPIDPKQIATDLGIANRVEWRAYVTDGELEELYRNAKAFLFLSDYEGFGMTPMEALAAGVPSVLLDTPISREVYGDGALRVPLETGAIAAALTRLLTDDAVRARVLIAGRSRLSAYSWERAATTITQALEQAAT